MIGHDARLLLVVENASGSVRQILDIAAASAPFPPAHGNAHPGLRRFIGAADAAADYARTLLRVLAPTINATFAVDGFDMLGARFSMVTASAAPRPMRTI